MDITPETALATELRYSENEYIEAVKDNDESDRLAIAEIGAISLLHSKFLRRNEK